MQEADRERFIQTLNEVSVPKTVLEFVTSSASLLTASRRSKSACLRDETGLPLVDGIFGGLRSPQLSSFEGLGNNSHKSDSLTVVRHDSSSTCDPSWNPLNSRQFHPGVSWRPAGSPRIDIPNGLKVSGVHVARSCKEWSRCGRNSLIPEPDLATYQWRAA